MMATNACRQGYYYTGQVLGRQLFNAPLVKLPNVLKTLFYYYKCANDWFLSALVGQPAQHAESIYSGTN